MKHGERRTFFDHHAETWEKDLRYEEKTGSIKAIVALFGVGKGEAILDVGTGTGVLLPFLQEAVGLGGLVVAMDFSFKMLFQAKKRHSLLVNAGVGAVPFRENSFDRVTCFSAFPHFPDKHRALLEMARVLKRGGYLFIAHLNSAEEINRFHGGVGGAVACDRIPDPDELIGMMEGSGLAEVSITNEPGRFLAKGRKS
jgi:ubiquinone/menaquinone biosynthesis C-methylase UbiE